MPFGMHATEGRDWGKVTPNIDNMIKNAIGGVMVSVGKFMVNRIQNTMEIVTKIIEDPIKGMQYTIGKIAGIIHKHVLTPMIKSKSKKWNLMGKSLAAVGKIGMGVFGIILMILEKLGILDPLMKIINAMLAILGGKIMVALMPLLMELMDILFSEETMELIDALAQLFVALLRPMLRLVIVILPILIPLLLDIVNAINEHAIPALEALTKWIEGISFKMPSGGGGGSGKGSGGTGNTGWDWFVDAMSSSATGGSGSSGSSGIFPSFQGGGVFKGEGLAWLHGPEIIEPYEEYQLRNRALLNTMDLLNLQIESMNENNRDLIHYLKYEM